MANLVELFDNIVQMQNLNGVPLAAGKLYVYALGRTRLMDSWSDVDGESLNPNPIILDDAGQAHVYVSDDFDYTLVVCDQYNNEIFSLDKYLYSKGSHSHADVAVAPSESIAVSSYHVGECTVYVPYLTGQLGKVYEGIDPIVVNNQVDKISANHVPLGVQDPLYFVQDDEEGCIIGCSAQTEIPSALSSKWDEASDAVIANSAQWAEGATYEAGSYVDIDGNTINVTGLQPAGNYQSAGDYVVHDELSSYATQDWVNEQGFLTAIPPEYVTENTLQSGLSSKLDSTAFSAVSGDFLTAHQSLDGLMSADLLEISDNKITGYNGTAFAGQGGGVTGDYELSAGSGISIVDYPLEQKTVISVTAQGGNPEVEQAVIDNSATWDSVTAKADITAIPSTAGLATEDWVTGQGYITNDAITSKQDITGMTAYQPAGDYLTTGDSANFATTGDIEDLVSAISETYQPITAMTAYQAAGDYLTTADSAEFYTTANDSGFITNDAITGKQDITGMTAYQPVGDYATTAQLADKVDSSAIGIREASVNLVSSISGMRLSAWTADNASYASTAGRANRDSLGNIITATYITGVPDTYLQNTDLTIADNKVTEISGIPLSAGTELEFEYDAADNISAINSSAISTTPAQALYAQSPLYFSATGTSSYMGINSADLARMLGVDETVLFETTASPTAEANLSESWKNFDHLKICVQNLSNDNGWTYVEVKPLDREGYTPYYNIVAGFSYGLGTNGMIWQNIIGTASDTKLTNCSSFGFQNSWTATSVTIRKNNLNDINCIRKVIGIGRKEV